MHDDEIEIFEEKVKETSKSDFALPVNFITVGEVSRDSVRVYIKQDVYKRIEKFAKEDISKEVGSILVGDYFDDNGKKNIVISSYIEAKYTDASASTLTFTHDTWNYVYKEKDSKYPNKSILGWQHTHPGYGIFLSNYDMFIQENFFNLPWQIAYVVDPIADTRGFFEWKNDKVSEMSGFYIYDEIGKEIKIREKAKPKRGQILSLSNFILSFLLLISVILAISFGVEKNNMLKKIEEITAYKDSESDKKDNTDVISKKEDEHDESIKSFKVYEVKKGDSLEKVCEMFSLDYNKNIVEIMRVNDIYDCNKIYVGQKLYLPIEK